MPYCILRQKYLAILYLENDCQRACVIGEDPSAYGRVRFKGRNRRLCLNKDLKLALMQINYLSICFLSYKYCIVTNL